MYTRKEHYLTLNEYDLVERTYDCKTEYADGEIWVTSDISIKHNQITVSILPKFLNYLEDRICKFSISWA